MQKNFHTFYIEGFEFDRNSLIAHFRYSFDREREFVEEISFADADFLPSSPVDRDKEDTFLFHISLALGISYYKLFPTENIIVESGHLDREMCQFWNKFYIHGLGEFFYENDMNPNGLAVFGAESDKKYLPIEFEVMDRALVPVGGGKDSIMTIEKVKKTGIEVSLFTFGKDNPIYDDMSDISGLSRLYVARKLSPTLFEMNTAGYYNGHVPITGVISFVMTFVAYLYGYKYIVFSNEQSSNFGNLDFHGLSVNHQYSKSKEFEDDFRSYLGRYISPSIEYFSMMRPYYELAIVREFAKEKKYFPYFTSCNRNFHLMEKRLTDTRWCLNCPKCAFVFACIHPYISKEERADIFHRDMYEKVSLIPLFRELAGVDGRKPFECVGTNEEILLAMYESIENLGDTPLPPILRDIQEKALSHMTQTDWNILNKKIFKKYENNIPPLFQGSQMLDFNSKIAILGFGREGVSTYHFLRKHGATDITIHDARGLKEFSEAEKNILLQEKHILGSDYLLGLGEYTSIIKSPGISPYHELIAPYRERLTSQTQIFFDIYPGKVIAVTGTKGKSTTTSLIYSMLRDAGHNIGIVGNIGSPVLDSIDNGYDAVVFEMSSYMLEGVHIDPYISVLMNLYREHLDYHQGFENYKKAKFSIIGPHSIIVAHTSLSGDLQNRKNKNIDFGPDGFYSISGGCFMEGKTVVAEASDTQLLGEHNQSNIAGAIAVARIYGVSEEGIVHTLRHFHGLPHRLEEVTSRKRITFYDDAISTTPESTLAAMRSLPDVETIFLGGSDRGYDFGKLLEHLLDSEVQNIVFFPDTGIRMYEELQKIPHYNPGRFTILHTSSMREAVEFAFQYTKERKTCLLSCASPSYSLWKSFEVKGDEYKKYISEHT